MNSQKYKTFFFKVVSDDAAKKELTDILDGKNLGEATDEQLEMIRGVVKKLGVDITAEEMKTIASGSVELDDNELEAVAGGATGDDFDPESVEQWWYIISGIKKDGSNIDEIAARYNLDSQMLRDNWQFMLQLINRKIWEYRVETGQA